MECFWQALKQHGLQMKWPISMLENLMSAGKEEMPLQFKGE